MAPPNFICLCVCLCVCPAFTAYISITRLCVGFWWNLVEMLELRSKRLHYNFMKIGLVITSLWHKFWHVFFVLLQRDKILRQRKNVITLCPDCDTSDSDLIFSTKHRIITALCSIKHTLRPPHAQMNKIICVEGWNKTKKRTCFFVRLVFYALF